MDLKYFQPLFEFGALIKYCEDYNLVRENVMVHLGMQDLAQIYYKVINTLPEKQMKYFEYEVQLAYDRFVKDLDAKMFTK